MERLGAPVPELSSDLLPKDQVLAPCVCDHSCRSKRHQHRQSVFLVEFHSRACLKKPGADQVQAATMRASLLEEPAHAATTGEPRPSLVTATNPR